MTPAFLLLLWCGVGLANMPTYMQVSLTMLGRLPLKKALVTLAYLLGWIMLWPVCMTTLNMRRDP